MYSVQYQTHGSPVINDIEFVSTADLDRWLEENDEQTSYVRIRPTKKVDSETSENPH